jgi:hypothetical protein
MAERRGFRRLGLLIAAAPAAALADALPWPEFSLHGLADLRHRQIDARPGWIDGGLGKFRAGGDAGRFRIDEAAVTVQARLWELAATATLKYAADQRNPVDLTEAFVSYRPLGSSAVRFGARLGAFFPPISLENTGTAWSSPYTLTSSAINTWVGEELRSFGGEFHASYQFEGGDRVGLMAAGFAHNDTAGTLLAWRGFALHDYEATSQDRLPLPGGIGTARFFPRQAGITRPFVEVDGRPGYYAGVTAERPESYKLRALYYDNRADTAALEHGQYGWHTRFWSLGGKLDLPWDLTLIGQGVTGHTSMGEAIGGSHPVDFGFWAASLLLSKSFGSHRFSLRHDRFGADENDLLPEDRNGEGGYAWTANYNLTWVQRHQVNFEVSRVVSRRPARLQLGQSSRQEEVLWQVAYRWFF